MSSTHDHYPCLVHASKLQRIEEDVMSLNHAIHGNGKPGLRHDLTELKAEVRTITRLVQWLLGILVPIAFSVGGYFVTQLVERL